MSVNIILASKSPRRKELLEQIDVKFSCMTSDKEEEIHSTIPFEVVCELSKQKAEDIERYLKEEKNGQGLMENLIIGADTVVAFDGNILGKPAGEEKAYEMIHMISGKKHEVYTGVTVIYLHKTDNGEIHRKELTFYECTKVYVHNLSEEDIRAYIKTGESLDKAGGYGIQGKFAKHVDKIDGDYNNVVGLPVARLYNEVKEKLGVDIVSEGSI